MSLRVRIAILLGAVAVGVSSTVAVLSYLETASGLRSGIDETLRSRAEAVADDGGGGGGERDADHTEGGEADDRCPDAGEFAPASAAQLVAGDGTVTRCIAGGPALPVADDELALADDEVRLRTVSVDGEELRVLTVAWGGGGVLQVARSAAEADALLRRLRWRLAVLVVVAAGVAAALGWAVATALARPIVRLRDAAHRIATTLDLGTPVAVGGPGEVGSLAASFSTMVGALRHSQDQQRRLVSDASHEMRTPLTSLRSNVELLRRIERLPLAERGEVVDDVLVDIDELATLLAELVDLASDLAAAEPDERVELADVARAAAARTERRAGRAVAVTEVAGAVLVGRPRQLERAIANLLENSVKYSPAGAEVDVVVEGTTVTVRDRGPGIPVGDLTRIFDRFYRAVDVRSAPGSGLGLAIVDEIVRSHGGVVFARNRADGGAEVGFTLPAPAAP